MRRRRGEEREKKTVRKPFDACCSFSLFALRCSLSSLPLSLSPLFLALFLSSPRIGIESARHPLREVAQQREEERASKKERERERAERENRMRALWRSIDSIASRFPFPFIIVLTFRVMLSVGASCLTLLQQPTKTASDAVATMLRWPGWAGTPARATGGGGAGATSAPGGPRRGRRRARTKRLAAAAPGLTVVVAAMMREGGGREETKKKRRKRVSSASEKRSENEK